MSGSGFPSVVASLRPWTTVFVSGPDAASWLNGLVTCDVSKLTDGVGAWGLLLNKRGKIVAELTLVLAGESLLLGTPGDCQELTRQLEDFLVMEDVEVENRAERYGWIQLHGSAAPEAAIRRLSFDGAWGRVDWLSSGGAVLVVPKARLDECLADLRGAQDVDVLDDEAWQGWRVRHGLPEFGIDFGPSDNPHQAGLDRRAVSWSKGCYLGQEVVCMQDMRGKVKRRLAKLLLPDGAVVAVGDVVNAESGAPVGSLTSVAAASSSEGRPRAAIAQLQAPYFEPGSTVYVGETPLTAEALWT